MSGATPEATDLDLHALAADVRPPARGAEQRARAHVERLLLPPDSLGELRRLAVWWAGVRDAAPAPPPAAVEVLVLAADHAVAVHGVSALRLGHTAVAARAVRQGRSAVDAVAAPLGMTVRLVDADVAGPNGPRAAPFDTGDAMTAQLLTESVHRGAALAEELAAGPTARDLLVLGDVGVGSTSTAAVVVGTVLRRDVLDVVGRGSGVDDQAWMRKAATVREGLRRARHRPRDVATVLQAVGSPDLALAVGLLLRTAALRLPVVLDGPVSTAAALLANRVSPVARQWWLVAERGDEPSQHRVVETFAAAPVLDLGVRAGAGVAGVLAAQVLRSAAQLAVGTVAAEEMWPAVQDVLVE